MQLVFLGRVRGRLTLVTGEELQRLNDPTSQLSVPIDAVALVAFALFGPVVWSVVVVRRL